MKLFVLRHGIADDHAEGGDSQRALTTEGRRKLSSVVAQACRAGMSPELILTSPYVRARETAEIAAKAAGFSQKLIETDNLVPYANPLELWEELRGRREAQQVLVVGHNPHLSDLLSVLLGAPGGAIPMKKAALACLDVRRLGPTPRATLAWLLTAGLAGG